MQCSTHPYPTVSVCTAIRTPYCTVSVCTAVRTLYCTMHVCTAVRTPYCTASVCTAVRTPYCTMHVCTAVRTRYCTAYVCSAVRTPTALSLSTVQYAPPLCTVPQIGQCARTLSHDNACYAIKNCIIMIQFEHVSGQMHIQLIYNSQYFHEGISLYMHTYLYVYRRTQIMNKI